MKTTIPTALVAAVALPVLLQAPAPVALLALSITLPAQRPAPSTLLETGSLKAIAHVFPQYPAPAPEARSTILAKGLHLSQIGMPTGSSTVIPTGIRKRSGVMCQVPACLLTTGFLPAPSALLL